MCFYGDLLYGEISLQMERRSLRIIAPAILSMIEMSFGKSQIMLALSKLAHRLHIDLMCSTVLPVIIPCQVINYKVESNQCLTRIVSRRDIVAGVQAFFGAAFHAYASRIRFGDQRIV